MLHHNRTPRGGLSHRLPRSICARLGSDPGMGMMKLAYQKQDAKNTPTTEKKTPQNRKTGARDTDIDWLEPSNAPIRTPKPRAPLPDIFLMEVVIMVVITQNTSTFPKRCSWWEVYLQQSESRRFAEYVPPESRRTD